MSHTLSITGCIFAVLLPLAIATCAVTLTIWLRRRAAVRRAGVGLDAPGCPACLYLMRGWNSPQCPECGTDVRLAGACIGVHVPLSMKLIAGMLVALLLSLAAGGALATWAFTTQSTLCIQRWENASRTFEFDLRALQRTRNISSAPQTQVQLTIAPRGGMNTLIIGFAREHWHPVLPTSSDIIERWRQLEIAHGQPTPTVEDILHAIGEVSGDAASGDSRAQAHWLAGQAQAMQSDPSAATANQPPAGLFAATGFGTSGISVFPQNINIWVLAFIVLCVATTALVIWRTHRPGWREVSGNEWAHAPGVRDTSLQQSHA